MTDDNDDSDDSNRLDWSIPSKAVIACDGKGTGCVLYTAGPHVAWDMREIGPALADLGLDNAPAGITVWEGITRSVRSRDGDYDAWLEGVYRPPNDEEWGAIRAGKCPWNDAAWINKRCSSCGGNHQSNLCIDKTDVADDPYEGSFREAADNEGARIAAEDRADREGGES